MTDTIPDSAFVPCPAKGFKNTRAVLCRECPHFKGLMDVMPDAAQASFESRYRIICAHAIARRTITVEL